MKFCVTELDGSTPDLSEIALTEQWAKHLVYCDMEGFAIEEDGTLLLLDECGGVASVPEARKFKVEVLPEQKP